MPGDGDHLRVLVHQGQGAEVVAGVVAQEADLHQGGHQGLQLICVENVPAGVAHMAEEGAHRGICGVVHRVVCAVAAGEHVECAGDALAAVAGIAGPEGKARARVCVAAPQGGQQAGGHQIFLIHDIEDAAGGRRGAVTALGAAGGREGVAVQAGNLAAQG